MKISRSEYRPQIYNVFGTLKINELDIGRIAKRLKRSIYDPAISPSLDVYIGGSLFKIYSSGTIECFGKSKEDVERGASELLYSLRKLGVHITNKPIVTLHSQAAVIRLGKRLRLQKAFYLLKGAEFAREGPKLLKLDLADPKTTFQLFENGTIICLGAQSEDDLKRGCSRIVELVNELGLAT